MVSSDIALTTVTNRCPLPRANERDLSFTPAFTKQVHIQTPLTRPPMLVTSNAEIRLIPLTNLASMIPCLHPIVGGYRATHVTTS